MTKHQVTITAQLLDNLPVQLHEKAVQNELKIYPPTSQLVRACPSPDAHTGKSSFSGGTFTPCSFAKDCIKQQGYICHECDESSLAYVFSDILGPSL